MLPLSRNLLKLAAAAGFSALASSLASADNMVQNLGPVRAHEGLLAAVGNMHVIAFFEPGSGRCIINAVVWDDLGPDPGESAKRIRVSVGEGEVVHIDTARQESLNLQCGSNAETLAIVDIESLSASGIAPQPPGQPAQ
jgi:hypothetical protein